MRWAAIIARHAVPRGLRIAVEPGDYLVKDAGLLLAQVNTVEDKAGTRFVGVDAGLGILNLWAYYRIAVCRRAVATRPRARASAYRSPATSTRQSTCSPRMSNSRHSRRATSLALMNVGGYGSAAASNHCMRGDFREILLP